MEEWNREALFCRGYLSTQHPVFMQVYFSLKFNSAGAKAHTGQPIASPRSYLRSALAVFFLRCVPVANFECALQRDARCRYSPLGQLLFLLSYIWQKKLHSCFKVYVVPCVVHGEKIFLFNFSRRDSPCEISWRRRAEKTLRWHARCR